MVQPQTYNKNTSRSLFLGIVTLIAFGITACETNKVSQSEAVVTEEALKIDRADSVTLLISKDGNTKARLRTKEFLQNDGAKPPYLDMNKGLQVEFYNMEMQVESILSAKTARFYPSNNNFLVRDSVVVVNTAGDTLKTQELVWNNQLQKFFSDVPVEIIRSGSSSFGSGMEANQDLTWIRIFNQRGTVPVEKDQMPEGE
jgi:LPS export ABC transporter protein LptC